MTDYIFIDESGDPGDNDGTSTNSRYYIEVALQLDSGGLRDLSKHIINWRYVRGIYSEPQQIHTRGLQRYLQPIIELHHSDMLKCSCVHLQKSDYTGPYLKVSSPKGQNPIRFRHYIHRQLLEFHFRTYPAQSENIDLVFDYYRMSEEALANLDMYIHRICNLPQVGRISHVESEICLPLQIVSQLASAVLAIQTGRLTGENAQLFGFISSKEITTDN